MHGECLTLEYKEHIFCCLFQLMHLGCCYIIPLNCFKKGMKEFCFCFLFSIIERTEMLVIVVFLQETRVTFN